MIYNGYRTTHIANLPAAGAREEGSQMKAFYETRNERMFIGGMTRYPFPLHVHEIVELVCVRSGACEMQIDGRSYTLREGDIAVAFPLVPHSYEKMSEDIDGFAAFFLPDTIAEFAGTFSTSLPACPVLPADRVSPDAILAIDRLLSMQDGAPSPSRLAFLHLLLANVLSTMELHPISGLSDRDMAYRVVKYISDHACEELTLATAARDLGISESHLSHLFSQRFHINFRRFINAIRIDKATMWMQDPRMTLTAVCDRCGFENMRTFRRAFVRETGALPNAYLKALREGSQPRSAPSP